MGLILRSSVGHDRSIEGLRSALESRLLPNAQIEASDSAVTVKATTRTTGIDSRSTAQVGAAVMAYLTQVARAGLDPTGQPAAAVVPGVGTATPVTASTGSVITGSAAPTIRPIDMLAAVFGAAAPAARSSNASLIESGRTATASQDGGSSALQQAIRAYAQDSDARASSRAG